MRPSTRSLLFGVALGALALSAVGIGGAAIARRQLAISREAAAARTQEAVTALLGETHAALRREGRLLARDPALVEGVARTDWAVVARGVSPRLADLTLERVADLVILLDASGAALLQVPPTPPALIANPAALSSSPAGLTVLNGHPYVVAAVPVTSHGEPSQARPLGFVVLARRLESVVPPASGVPDRPGVVFLDHGRPIVSTLQASATEWARAIASGSLRLEGGRDYLVRPASEVTVAGPGRLWVVVADGSEGRRKALNASLVVLAVCALGSAGAGAARPMWSPPRERCWMPSALSRKWMWGACISSIRPTAR